MAVGRPYADLAPDIPAMEANIARTVKPPKPRRTVGDEVRQTKNAIKDFNRQMRQQRRPQRPNRGTVTGDV